MAHTVTGWVRARRKARRRREDVADTAAADAFRRMPPPRAITEQERQDEATLTELLPITDLAPMVFYTIPDPPGIGDPLTAPLPDGLIMAAPLIFEALACPSHLDGQPCERLRRHPRRGGHATGTGWHAHSRDWVADLRAPVVRWRDRKVAA